MPKNHKRPPPPVVTRKTVYWIIAVIFVCYMLHISSEVRTLSNFVETDPNDVYHLLKDPVNLLVLHPKAWVFFLFFIFYKLYDLQFTETKWGGGQHIATFVKLLNI